MHSWYSYTSLHRLTNQQRPSRVIFNTRGVAGKRLYSPLGYVCETKCGRPLRNHS
jgi:hypothetical protein